MYILIVMVCILILMVHILLWNIMHIIKKNLKKIKF